MKHDARIESIPAEEIGKILADYDAIKSYTKGSYIDAHDKISWKVAVVTNESPGAISIHYEGWGPRFDEVDVKTSAYKITPFRKFTTGYTGQAKQAYRMFKYSKEEHDKISTKLSELLKDPFSMQDPEKYTQFVRGELFFYVDSLLTMLQIANPSAESIKEILKFLKIYLNFIVEWFKVSWDLANEFEASEKWDLLYKVHGRTAVSMAYPELAETLCEFFGGCKRTLPSFKLIFANTEDKEGIEVGNGPDADLKWCATYFYRHFKTKGGFQEILKMLRDEKKEGYKLRVGLKFIEAIAPIFENVVDGEVEAYAAELADAILVRIKEDNEKDMKEIDKITVKGFFKSIGCILDKCKKATGKDVKGEIEARLVAGQIKSNNLVRKLQGINLIKENYDLVKLLKESPYSLKESKDGKHKLALKVLAEIGITEIIFHEFPHPELIKRSAEIIHLLVISGLFKDQNTDLLLECYRSNCFSLPLLDKHEEVKLPILNIVIEMAEYAPYHTLEKIFQELRRIPLNLITETFLSFVCLYTINVLKNIQRKKEEVNKLLRQLAKRKEEPSKDLLDTNFKLYDLDILWEVMVYSRKDVRIEPKLKDHAINCLIKIVETSEELAKQFFVKALDGIKENTGSSIRCMKFFSTCYKYLKKKRDVKRFARKLITKESGVLDILMENFVKYKKIVNKVAAIEKDLKNPMLFVNFLFYKIRKEFAHCWKHEECLKGYFEFIEFLIYVNKGVLELSYNHLNNMWDLLVTHAICQEETNFFYLHLIKAPEKARRYQKFALLNDENARYLFETFFLQESKFVIKYLNNISYTTFKTLLTAVNIAKGSFKQDKDKLITLNEGVIGIELLWIITFDCAEKEIREQAGKFLISIYSCIGNRFMEKLQTVAQSFVVFALEKADKVPNDKDRVMAAIKMIKSYIKESEGTKYVKIDKTMYQAAPLIALRMEIRRTNRPPQVVSFKICKNLTIFHLKNAISATLKLPLARLKLRHKQKNFVLTEQQHDKELIKNLISESKEVQFIVEVRPLDIPKEKTPSYAIANFERGKTGLLKFMKLDERFAEEIWKLVKGFPEDTLLYGTLINLELPAVDAWEEFMNPEKELHILLCNVHAMKKLITRRQLGIRIPENYVELFIKKNGFTFFQAKYKEFAKGLISGDSNSYLKTRLVKYTLKAMTAVIQSPSAKYISQSLAEIESLVKTVQEFLKYFIVARDSSGAVLAENEYNTLLSKTIYATFTFHNALGNAYPEIVMKSLESTDTLYSVLKAVWTKPHNVHFSEFFADSIVSCIKAHKGEFSKCLIERVLVKPLNESNETLLLLRDDYFTFCCKVIEAFPEETLDFNTYAQKLSQIICESPSLKGFIEVFTTLYKKFHIKLGPWADSLASILQDLSFDLTDTKYRKQALELLKELCANNQSYIRLIISKFHHLIKDPKWRTSRPGDWEIYIEDQVSQSSRRSKFVGLDNPANICYMNSVLQQLYMTPSFRKGLLEVDHLNSENPHITTDLLSYMKLLFGTLKDSKRESYSASHLCALIKDFDGRPLSIYEQHDADEFFNLLMDRLETNLKSTSRPQLIKDVFGGAFMNEVICVDCPHKSAVKEEFLAVNLQIHNKRTLTEGLNAYIDAEQLTGSNAYYCERCDKKVNAKKRVSLGVLPNVLMVVLKRFEFDFQRKYYLNCIKLHSTKIKLNDYFEFPMELNLERYTQEYLNKKDVLEKIESGVSESELTDEEKTLLNLQIPPEYYMYKLHGVILHMGTADSGHYTSIAFDRESSATAQWYEFNDSRVKEFNPDLMQVEAFGTSGKYPKTKNAYMLIYERSAYFHMPSIRQLSEEQRFTKDPTKTKAGYENAKIDYNSLLAIKVSADIEDQVVAENARQKQTKTVLNSDYIGLINDLLKRSDYMGVDDYKFVKMLNLQAPLSFEEHKIEPKKYMESLEKLQFFGIYVFTALLRVTLKSQYPPILRALRRAVENDLGFSVWLIETFLHPYIVQEFLINCPVSASRFFVASLLNAAFAKVFKKEEKRIEKYVQDPKLLAVKLLKKAEVKPFAFLDDKNAGQEAFTLDQKKKGAPYCLLFVNNLLSLITRAVGNRQCLPEYFFLLSSLCRQRPLIIKLLLDNGMLGLLIEIILETSGDSIVQAQKRKPVVLKKELNLGFQKPATEKVSKPGLLGIFNVRVKQLRFLIEMLSQLIRGCSIKSESSVSETLPLGLKYVVTESEGTALKNLMGTSGLQKLLLYGNNNVARKGIADILSYLAFENRDFSKTCLEFLLVRLSRVGYKDLPAYLIPIESLVSLKDSLEDNRIHTFVANFLQLTKKEICESYIAYLYLTDVFIKLALRNEAIHKMVQSNPDKFMHIKTWLKKYSYPMQEEIFWEKTSTRAIEIKSELLPADRAACKLYNKQKAKILSALQQVATPKKPAPDLSTFTFEPEDYWNPREFDFSEPAVLNKIFDIKINGKWCIGVVTESAQDVLHFMYQLPEAEEGPREKWIKAYSDKVALHKTRTQNDASLLYAALRRYIEAWN